MLLVDVLDSVGADPADARERVAILRAAGARVSVIVIGSEPDAGARTGRALQTLAPGPAAVSAVREQAQSHDLVLIASAEPGGGALSLSLPADSHAVWWPTGIGTAPAGNWLGRLLRRTTARSRLPSLLEDGSPPDALEARALGGCVVETVRARRPTLPLWDGDVALAPAGLEGPGGAVALEAFASLASEWSALDLVAWSHPRASVVEHARRLGVEPRVHTVGPPPRKAEWAWWSQAQAVVLTGDARLSGGLVLRALTAGCPLLWVPCDPQTASLARALADRGCAFVAEPQPRRVAKVLEQMFERSPAVDEVVARGRVFAADYGRDALAARLAALLGVRRPPARPAAAA